MPIVLRKTQSGFNALRRAAEYSNADCVRVLLEAGADKDAANHVRCTGRAARLLHISVSINT